MMDKHDEIKKKLIALGEKLEFIAYEEVGTGPARSSWPDVVWFDKRVKGEWFDGVIPVEQKGRQRKDGKPSLDTDFVLPVIGFEIDEVNNSPKTIKGSASNLDALGAQVGVIVIYSATNDPSGKKLMDSKINTHRYLTDMKPRIRIVVLTELELEQVITNIGV